MSNVSSVPESTQSVNPSSYSLPQKRSAAFYFYIGLLCAFISLLVVPEIFGSAAIILGAYTWRMERDGIVAMLVGIYYTAYFGIYNILP